MKPKTVRRVKSEQDSQTRAYPMHAALLQAALSLQQREKSLLNTYPRATKS